MTKDSEVRGVVNNKVAAGRSRPSVALRDPSLQLCAKFFGITTFQCMILSAAREFAARDGVTSGALAVAVNVDLSRVAAQARLLESKGFCICRAPTKDPATLQINLTDVVRDQFQKLDMWLAAMAAVAGKTGGDVELEQLITCIIGDW